ncbi:MAG: ribonuclease H-like domain-containing protein [bacterium]|jgi:hypothetical protein
MLDATFIHAPTIGATTEQRLWQAGILSWSDYLRAAPSDLPLTAAQREILAPAVEHAAEALANDDDRYFARLLPMREHWRAVPHFMERIGFLDIETNGGYQPEDVTLIGVYDGYESRFFIKGRNLEDFSQEAERVRLWITFFGTGFDLPFLRRRFPKLPLDHLHVDLCPSLRKLGFKGGLKRVETQLGIHRRPEVDGMDGMDAVRLWSQYRRHNDEDALNLLITYNREDIENLSLLLAFTYPRLKAASGFPVGVTSLAGVDSASDSISS